MSESTTDHLINKGEISDNSLVYLSLLCKDNSALKQVLLALEQTPGSKTKAPAQSNIGNHTMLTLIKHAFNHPGGIFKSLVNILSQIQMLTNNISSQQNKLKELISTDRKNLELVSKIYDDEDNKASLNPTKTRRYVSDFLTRDLGALDAAFTEIRGLFEEIKKLNIVFTTDIVSVASKLDALISESITDEDSKALVDIFSDLKKSEFLAAALLAKSYYSIAQEADELKERYQDTPDISNLKDFLEVSLKHALAEQLKATLSMDQQKAVLNQASGLISKLAETEANKFASFNTELQKRFAESIAKIQQQYTALYDRFYQQGVLTKANTDARSEAQETISELVSQNAAHINDQLKL